MNIIGLIGIFVALALLIILVYKGVHVVVAGALAAILVAVTNGLGATNGYGTIYLSGMAGSLPPTCLSICGEEFLANSSTPAELPVP